LEYYYNMKRGTKGLQKIAPEKIGWSKNNLFLTLALIKNDFSDLVYLQSLFNDDNQNIKTGLNPDGGQYAGRRIYILRLALSHFYSFLEFINKRSEEISKNEKLATIIKRLTKNDRKLWEDLQLLSENLFSKKSTTFSELIIKQDIIRILELSNSARNEFTYHYYHSSNFLSHGFRKAFIEDRRTEMNSFACIIEERDIKKDRCFYIDLSVQKYLEDKANLKKNLFESEKEFVDLLAIANRVITKILEIYHQDLQETQSAQETPSN